jgi:hypothetical protein
MGTYDAIAAKLSQNRELKGEISFTSPGYKTVGFSKDNYRHIQPQMSRKKIAFVDGGEGCVLEMPDFSVHLIQAVGLVMDDHKTTDIKKTVFFAVMKSGSEGAEIQYSADVVPIKGNAPAGFSCDSMDNRIKSGVDRGSISSLSQVLRHCAELMLAEEMLGVLEAGDVIVLDGTLEARFEPEVVELHRLIEQAKDRGILLTAVSKGSSMLTDSGASVMDLLMEQGPEGSWAYYPVAESTLESHPALITFAKLHPASRHVLRIEILKEQADLTDLGRLFSILAVASRDYSIPGYPYGLIKADRLARVQNSEVRHAKMMLLSRMPQLDRKTVHELLDSIG